MLLPLAFVVQPVPVVAAPSSPQVNRLFIIPRVTTVPLPPVVVGIAVVEVTPPSETNPGAVKVTVGRSKYVDGGPNPAEGEVEGERWDKAAAIEAVDGNRIETDGLLPFLDNVGDGGTDLLTGLCDEEGQEGEESAMSTTVRRRGQVKRKPPCGALGRRVCGMPTRSR